MDFITKIVISVNHNTLSIELVFNILQRKVFADNKLDIYILTSDVDLVRNMAVNISKCCFFNLNGSYSLHQTKVVFNFLTFINVFV